MRKILKKIKEYKKSLRALPWLLRRLRGKMPMLILLILIQGLTAFLGVEFAVMMQRVIDTAVSGQKDELVHAAVGICIVILGMILCSILSQDLTSRIDMSLDRELKREYMTYIINGDLRAVSEYHSGDLVNRLSGDVMKICSGLTAIVPSLFSLLVSLVSTIVVLQHISWQIMLLLLGVSVVLCAGALVLGRFVKRINQSVSQADGRVTGFVQEMISHLLIVQALDAGTTITKKTEELLNERYDLQRRRKKLSIAMGTGMSFITYLIELVALLWAAMKLFGGMITVGQLTAVTQLAAKLEAPLLILPGMTIQCFVMLASAERLRAIEALPQLAPKATLDADPAYAQMTAIEGRDVSFAYDRDPVLDHVSFSIPKGKTTVITGASGIGKSTLLKLLLGIYEPDEGEMVVAGPQGELRLNRDSRTLFTYAPQGNLLISGTLRENLTLVYPEATDEEIDRAVYISCMDDYLKDMPQGLDTPIKENAAGISEGQAQRVALARAILSSAPILLLDEVTSSLDRETEKRVLERIRTLKGRTCIVVTHRPTVLELADYHMHIGDDGTVVCEDLATAYNR